MAKKLHFPDGFLWGAATSSYQVEGIIKNVDWYKAAEKGRVPLVHNGINHYQEFENDFDLARELGHNAHRFSIEWARIEPHEGELSEEGVTHYQEVLRALRARNITPAVTLWHFTLPDWLARKGGITHKEFPFYFARYASFLADRLNLDGCLVFTMNEPHVQMEMGWLVGKWPPFHKGDFIGWMRGLRNLSRAHSKAYEKIKEKHPELSVGVVLHGKYGRANWNPINKLRARLLMWYRNHQFLDAVEEKVDMIGFNYYRHHSFGLRDTFPKTDFGWYIYPEGIYHALCDMKKYKKPIYITENGLADAKDEKRAKFIRDHLKWVHRGIVEGVDVQGYFYWSLLDNFEWAEGYKMRFGLIEIDFATKERNIRNSAWEFKKIIDTNTLET
ncbi:MAG: glycoside hydrolase family 1 protein [Candidatus Paceibacterota bacterium]